LTNALYFVSHLRSASSTYHPLVFIPLIVRLLGHQSYNMYFLLRLKHILNFGNNSTSLMLFYLHGQTRTNVLEQFVASCSRLPFPPQSRRGDSVAKAGRVVRRREIRLGRREGKDGLYPEEKPVQGGDSEKELRVAVYDRTRTPFAFIEKRSSGDQ
jgi:hypothetical protein